MDSRADLPPGHSYTMETRTGHLVLERPVLYQKLFLNTIPLASTPSHGVLRTRVALLHSHTYLFLFTCALGGREPTTTDARDPRHALTLLLENKLAPLTTIRHIHHTHVGRSSFHGHAHGIHHPLASEEGKGVGGVHTSEDSMTGRSSDSFPRGDLQDRVVTAGLTEQPALTLVSWLHGP